MNIESIRKLALSLPQVKETVKWEKSLCFTVYEKIFLLVSLDEVPTRCSVKVAKEDFSELVCKDNHKQARYLAKGQWISIDDIKLEDDTYMLEVISNSYRLITEKLSKKLRSQLL